jgi:hypothetical protein
VTAPSRTRTLAEQLSGAFVFFGSLVAVAFVITALSYGIGRMWLTPELERSQLAVRTESRVHAAMLDEESGLRGYLLTRDLHFIEPYARGKVALADANQILTASMGAVPELAEAMLETRLAEERWRERWAKGAADNPGPNASPPSMAAGKALFDDYRFKEAGFADALGRHIDLLSHREERMLAARVALELAVFIAVLFLAMRQHRTLREAIVEP